MGPDIHGVSGEPTHIRTLLSSPLSEEFSLYYCRVGGGERRPKPENFLRRNAARLLSPLGVAMRIMLERPHLVHINNTFNFKGLIRDCSLSVVAKILGRKVVFEMHGGHPEAWLSRHPIMKPLVLFALRRVDRVIALSADQERFLLGFMPVGRFKRIPNMVNPHDYVPSEPAEPPVFLYMGRLHESKGIFVLVEALGKLSGDCRLWFAGDGPDRLMLERAIRDRGLSRRAKVLGFVINDEKIRVLSSAYAMVLPSFHEGIPYAILEGLASALPVIATAVGGVPSVVRDGSDGFLVPPGDPAALASAMERLLSDKSLRDNMAAKARERSFDFSVGRISAQYIEVYREAMG
ncbi:MAG: glycosyltransferase family 4 protein [Candidatus Hydrothermia bacterium]